MSVRALAFSALCPYSAYPPALMEALPGKGVALLEIGVGMHPA